MQSHRFDKENKTVSQSLTRLSESEAEMEEATNHNARKFCLQFQQYSFCSIKTNVQSHEWSWYYVSDSIGLIFTKLDRSALLTTTLIPTLLLVKTSIKLNEKNYYKESLTEQGYTKLYLA